MMNSLDTSKKNSQVSKSYQRTQMQKELVLKRLKEEGCRITKQRKILLDIILADDCSCSKEIYYKAIKIDSNIGPATVYRMVRTLEEIGAISRKNMYKISCDPKRCADCGYTIEFEDNTVIELPMKTWNQIIETGLRACGYVNNKKVRNVVSR